MEEGSNDKQSVTAKGSKRGSFTSVNRRNYEVYSSLKQFIEISDPTKRRPGRIKSLSFKRKRLSHCVEETRSMDDMNGPDNVQQIRISRSQPDLCTNCKLKITDSDELVVELHEELYHFYCFQCIQCGNKIDPKADYILIEDGKPLCSSCIPECRGCGETIVSSHAEVIGKDYHENCLLCTFCRKVIFKCSVWLHK